MSHLIYTGSFAALELRWLDTVSRLQREDPLREINVLVGSNILASYLKRRLAETGRTAANIRFHTFLDLVGRLASSSPAMERPRLPRLGSSIILDSLLAEKTPPVFAPVSGYRGFRDALLETFRDLRDAGFTPGDLEAAIRKGRDRDRSEHLQASADLYRRYRETVGGFHDVDDDFRTAIRNAGTSGEGLPFRQLLVYGVYDVTGQQSRLLATLKDSLDMIYFIPFVDEMVSEFARPFVESRSVELGVKPFLLDTEPPASGLESLEAAGFGFSSQCGSLVDDGSFALVSVPGESRAAVEILREIFRAVHDGTIRGFHEAAVILRQPEGDLPVLIEIFRLRGVPYFIHGGRSFADRPLGKAIVALSRLEANSFSREAVLAAMELLAAALPADSASRWDVQGWRALTNDPRFLAGLESWDSGTGDLIEKAQSDLRKAEAHPDEDAGDEQETGVRSARMARRRLEAATLLRDAWQLVRQAAGAWPAELAWDDWAHLLEQRLGPLLGRAEDWHFFSSVLDELAGLQTIGGGRAVPADRLRTSLVDAISSHSCPVGRFQRSGVNLLSTSAARGLRFPLVVIPGLEEGRFPARLRQDPLLLDAERASMGALPVKSKRAEEEKLLFDMAARSAEKRLVLMTSRLDEGSDRERIPSQFFLRVASAVRGGAVTIRDLARGTVPGFRSVSLDNPAPAQNEIPVDEGEIRLRMVIAERKSAKTARRTLAELEPARFSRPLEYDGARWEHRLTSFDGRITDPTLVRWTAQRLGASAAQVSASRLEEYIKCPYFFFLKRVMELGAWEEQGKIEAMDPLDRGLAIHAILETFLRASGEAVFQISREKLWRELENLARRILDSARPAGLPDLLWEIERDALVHMLKGWLEFEKGRADDEMRVVRLEQVFGEFAPEEKFPALRVRAGRHTFDFRGRIDRVDFSRDRKRARVVDYKTGTLPDSMANKKTRTPLMSGERIQLVIYAGALSVLHEFEGVETIEGEYLHLQPRNGLTVPCSFTHEELENAARALPDILEIAGDGIESGTFFARTSGRIRPSGHCDFCDYLPVCGKDRVRREERKANDPAVQKFLRIVESA